MPEVQLENGYLRIANELLDAIIRFPFSKRQYKVLFYIIRKTYGFGKKEDDMTVTQIANGTGLTRPHASGTLHELVEMQTVLKRDGRHGYVVGINKNYGKWQPSQNGTCPETGTTPSQNGTETVPKRDTQKTTPKDNTKRKRFVPPTEQEVVQYFLDNGYSRDAAIRAFRGYDAADWHDSRGNKIKNWKQKMQHVWFKSENKADKLDKKPI